jgi:hypothetical protein
MRDQIIGVLDKKTFAALLQKIYAQNMIYPTATKKHVPNL